MKTWNRFTISELASLHNRDILNAPFIIQKLEDRYRHKGNCRFVKYEDIVADPKGEFSKLYNWLGLHFSDEVLDISHNKKHLGKYGDPVGIKSNESPKDSSLFQWKKDLDNKEFSFFLNGYGHYLGNEFLEKYGYEDNIKYKSNFRFKLFQYCALRQSPVKFLKFKDLIVNRLVRFYDSKSKGK